MYNVICGLSANSGEMYSLLRSVNSVGEVCVFVLINDLAVLRSFRLIPSPYIRYTYGMIYSGTP